MIALNQTKTEAYHSLAKYDCLLTGKNSAAMARAILKFYQDRKLRAKLEANTLKAKKELSWDYLIDGLIKFYATLK